MNDIVRSLDAQDIAEADIDRFRKALGPFVTATETTRMPMIFTDAQRVGYPVIFANDSFLALTGFDRADLMGKDLKSLLSTVANPTIWTAIDDTLRGGADGEWATKCRRVDGSEYLANVFASPVRDTTGKIAQYFLSFIGLGEHEGALEVQRQEIHALYEQAPGFIATAEGPYHRFTFANGSYKRLVGRDRLIGRTVREALPEVIAQGLGDALDRVFETGEPFVASQMPVRFEPTKGEPPVQRYISFVYQPIRDGEGRVTGVFCEGYDATAERLAAEKLASLQSKVAHTSRVNAMGMMAATLAHEINQPLMTISMYAAGALRLLDRVPMDEAALAEVLGSVDKAAQRAGSIIRHLREMTRRGETSRQTFDASAALTECIELVRAGGCQGVQLINRLESNVTVSADRVQLQQVAINLIRNACDAAAAVEGGRVVVEAIERTGDILFSIKDNGPGVAPEAAEALFEWTETSKAGGMGLGLSIARTIVESHGGRVWLEQSDSSGSIFCFSIPHKEADTSEK